MHVLVALCVCAFVYQCMGVAYPCGVRGCPRIIDLFLLKSNMPFYQHDHSIPIVGMGKERRTLIGPW